MAAQQSPQGMSEQRNQEGNDPPQGGAAQRINDLYLAQVHASAQMNAASCARYQQTCFLSTESKRPAAALGSGIERQRLCSLHQVFENLRQGQDAV